MIGGVSIGGRLGKNSSPFMYYVHKAWYSKKGNKKSMAELMQMRKVKSGYKKWSKSKKTLGIRKQKKTTKKKKRKTSKKKKAKKGKKKAKK